MTATRYITMVILAVAHGLPVLAQNVITQWGDVPPGAYDIDQQAGEILILEGGGYAFKFYAEDPPGSPGTGVINNITVDPNAVGDFSLLIAYPVDPNDPNSPVAPNEAGALDWNEGDLTYTGGTSTVTGRVAHPSRSEGWGRDWFGGKAEDSAMCGGGY